MRPSLHIHRPLVPMPLMSRQAAAPVPDKPRRKAAARWRQLESPCDSSKEGPLNGVDGRRGFTEFDVGAEKILSNEIQFEILMTFPGQIHIEASVAWKLVSREPARKVCVGG